MQSERNENQEDPKGKFWSDIVLMHKLIWWAKNISHTTSYNFLAVWIIY